VWRDLRAGSESGWDFSSRWLADGLHLWTIRTTDIAPVDLNSLMMHLEQVLAKTYRKKSDSAKVKLYESRATARSAAIRRLMWDAHSGMFVDYLWRERRPSLTLSAATVYPLFFGVAAQAQARLVAASLRDNFLKPGGLATTLTATGQQWDRPNGWAPLQYLAIEGLNAYGERHLAEEIARRWIRTDIVSFQASGDLAEKYNVESRPDKTSGAAGGEYAVQVGFGWTNGVLAKLMSQYPRETAAATLSHSSGPN
jgi:alpha,alpha-trehalase